MTKLEKKGKSIFEIEVVTKLKGNRYFEQQQYQNQHQQ